MTANLLSGIEVAEAVVADVRNRVEKLARKGIQPGLGTILVGDDGPSESYVRKKHEACENAGIRSFHLQLPATISQQEFLDAVAEFNNNDEVDGYIIQYPVPQGLDFNEALMSMNPAKDADGLHTVNLGKLVLQATIAQDLYLVVGSLTYSVLLIVIGNLIADILLAIIDPRVRMR